MSRPEPLNRSGGRWTEALPAVPWRRRRRSLADLFETIAPSYDRLNRILSCGFDERWRARAAQEALGSTETGLVLDLASGTGDLAAALIRRAPSCRVVRLDLSATLMKRGDRKLPSGSSHPAVVAEMERLPIRPGRCRAVTMGYALRHVESLDRLMSAAAEVLGDGGRVSFVDMSLPTRGIWGRIYRVYFRWFLPRMAAILGGERDAYELLVRSVEAFPGWSALEQSARSAGFREIGCRKLTGGAATVFVAVCGKRVDGESGDSAQSD